MKKIRGESVWYPSLWLQILPVAIAGPLEKQGTRRRRALKYQQIVRTRTSLSHSKNGSNRSVKC